MYGRRADIRVQAALSPSSTPSTPQVLEKLEKRRGNVAVDLIVSLVRYQSLHSPAFPIHIPHSDPRFCGLVQRVVCMQLLTAFGSQVSCFA